jgi:hypothetical protein
VKFGYQTEKLAQARSALMLPHHNGEAASIAECFEFCERAFHHFDASGLDDYAREWVETITGFMDTTGIEADGGLWLIKAASLTPEEKYQLSNAVDQLASWFSREWHNS